MRKFGFSILIFILIELAVLVVVGNWIGVLPTLLFVALSSVAGVFLIKRIGTHSVKEIEQSIKGGQAPTYPIIRGFITLVGSSFLIVPGFITTIVGLFMLMPFTQKLFKPFIFFWLRKKMKNSRVVIYQK
jgi:UPF0716 protein FxsA